MASKLFMERLVFGNSVAAVLVSGCRSDDKKENEATRTEGPIDSSLGRVNRSSVSPEGSTFLLYSIPEGPHAFSRIPSREWERKMMKENSRVM